MGATKDPRTGPDLSSLAPGEREALAEHWLREAALEHASVASFSRFSLQLMAVGAPPELLVGAHRAALDEVDHARRSYALASAYAGRGYGPGPLPLGGVSFDDASPASVALETFMDGCVNETVAALVARAGAEAAADPAVREALAAIAADEERHAELAWKTVAWLLRSGGTGVREELAGAAAELAGAGPAVDVGAAARPDADPLARHGVVSPAAQEEIRARAVAEVILPCARALLAE